MVERRPTGLCRPWVGSFSVRPCARLSTRCLGRQPKPVLRRAAGLAWCGHGGSARQANLKQGLPVALGRFSGCCSLQLNSRRVLPSVLPAASEAARLGTRFLYLLCSRIGSRHRCHRGGKLSRHSGERGIAFVVSSHAHGFTVAATRTDGKSIELTRIEETTLTHNS